MLKNFLTVLDFLLNFKKKFFFNLQEKKIIFLVQASYFLIDNGKSVFYFKIIFYDLNISKIILFYVN